MTSMINRFNLLIGVAVQPRLRFDAQGYWRLASGDRIRVGMQPSEVWLSLLEAPISRDVQRVVVLTREEAALLAQELTR